MTFSFILPAARSPLHAAKGDALCKRELIFDSSQEETLTKASLLLAFV